MEKRFTAKTEDNSISDAPDRKTGLVLLIISGALILAIGFAVAAAVKINVRKHGRDNIPDRYRAFAVCCSGRIFRRHLS